MTNAICGINFQPSLRGNGAYLRRQTLAEKDLRQKRRFIVPEEGHTIIAQRFNAGFRPGNISPDEGTTENAPVVVV